MSGLCLLQRFHCNRAALTQLEEEASSAAANPGWQAAGTRGSVPQNRWVEFTQEDIDHGGACCDHTFANHRQSHGEVRKPCEKRGSLCSLMQHFLRKGTLVLFFFWVAGQLTLVPRESTSRY